jgi:hypothetical protein
MRKLPLLVFVLLLLLAAAGPAPALSVPSPATALSEEAEELEGETDEADDEAEADEPEDEKEDGEAPGECTIEDEEDVQLCAEIAQEEKEEAEAERCVLESASAKVDASPSSGKVRLTVRYTTYRAAPFSFQYSLRGSKGGLHLGSAKASLGRTGTFHDVVRVSDRKMAKVLAAREFQIELRALQAPGSCRELLTVQRRGASRPHWS